MFHSIGDFLDEFTIKVIKLDMKKKRVVEMGFASSKRDL